MKHSHSMRDQTSHMKEKYQARYQHRRLSIRTPTGSNNNTPKVTMVTMLYCCNVYIK